MDFYPAKTALCRSRFCGSIALRFFKGGNQPEIESKWLQYLPYGRLEMKLWRSWNASAKTQVGPRRMHMTLCVTYAASARFNAYSAERISAAFSPIMIDAALVFPLTISGMTLASAIRKFPIPLTRSF